MGGCGSLGHERDFLHVLLGANLLIIILDGPREFSGISGTAGPDEKNQGGHSAKSWRHFRRP